jgi:hypothetical protein
MATRKRKTKTGPRVVRCSSLLYGARCTAAVAQEEEVRKQFSIPARISNEGSRLGVAYHALQAYSQKHGYERAREEIETFARNHGADARELGWLWSRLRVDSPVEYFDKILVEESVSVTIQPGLVLEGTPDLQRLYNKGKSLDVVDWKSGRLAISDDPDAYGHDQVISYVVAAVMTQGEASIQTARAIIYPVRLGDKPTIYSLDSKAYAKEAERILKLAQDMDAQRNLDPVDREYGTGPHCRYCDGRRTCPAYRKDMEAAYAFVDLPVATGKGARAKNAKRKGLIEAKVGEAVAQQPLRAYGFYRLAGELHESLKSALRHDVEFWGSIDTDDGKWLGLKPYRAPATLTADYAREVLVRVLTQRLTKKLAGEQLTDIIDEIDGELRNRPMLDRERFGHYKKE